MEKTPIKDKNGNSYGDAIFYDGYTFAPFKPNDDVVQHLKDLDSLTFTGDEVVVAAYPRSGYHWLYDIVHMLKTSTLDYTRRTDATSAFDFLQLDQLKECNFKVFGTHYYPRFLPKDFIQKRNKMICVYRNPKDVVVSYCTIVKKMDYWKEFGIQMDGFLEIFLKGHVICGKWLDHIREWEKYKRENPEHPVLLISYEDLRENLIQGVQRISDFLGLEHPKSFIEEVAKKCEFENMCSYNQKNISDSATDMAADSHKGENILYSKGVVGNWKDVLTVGQNEMIDDELTDAIQRLDSTIRFSF